MDLRYYNGTIVTVKMGRERLPGNGWEVKPLDFT